MRELEQKLIITIMQGQQHNKIYTVQFHTFSNSSGRGTNGKTNAACEFCDIYSLHLVTRRYVCKSLIDRLIILVGPGSSVGIATDYWLGAPGIEFQWGEVFRPCRPALGPTQPPVQWVPCLLQG